MKNKRLVVNEAVIMQNLELESDSSKNVEDVTDLDEDICSKKDLQTYFPCVKSNSEVDLNNQNSYVLHLSATLDSNPNVAAGLTNEICEVLKLSDSHLHRSSTLNINKKIIDVKFNPENDQLLYVGTSDGCIQMWDLRTAEKSVTEFKDTSQEGNKSKVKPFTCFDVSFDNRLLAGGTEVFEGDAFILFWDTRNKNLMGGYWESHTDDITEVKFHPNDINKLISGSTDGLINYYDLSQTVEDDALIDSLNSESSVEQLLWYKQQNNHDAICCITHTADVQLWTLDHAMPYAEFHRPQIAEKLMRKSEGHCFVASSHAQRDRNDLLLLAGSNFRDGECFRALNVSDGSLSPLCSFENKQRVRSTWYNENMSVLISGGEKGLIDVWSLKNVGNCDSELSAANKSKKIRRN